MSGAEIARKVAQSLNLLDEDGRLVELDSMTIVDYVVALETELELEIPSSILASFTSLEGVGGALDALRAPAA